MLAIIIPYYKLTFFDETLKSLANQTDKRFKVYIGDDASPEKPVELLEKFNGKFDFIYQRFETNLGGSSLTKQWERCIALSGDEEWIMILGDDDCIGENCVEEFFKNKEQIIKNNYNVLRFATIEINGNDEIISEVYVHPEFEKATDSFYRKIRNKTRSSLSEYIFSRKAYEKYGFFNYDLAWYSDDRAWLEFTKDNFIFSINCAIVQFRLSNENISRKDYRIKEKEKIKLFFFNFLIFDFFDNFTRDQRKYLLLQYEQMIYRNQKTTFNWWYYVFLLFLKNSFFLESIKFTRRVLIYLNKNDKIF